MRAIILAGGKGRRLKPYTTLIPKPLVPLGGKYSVLEIIISQLKQAGFCHITLAVNHLSHLIKSYFDNGSRLGVKLDYSEEEEELSTIGPLTLLDDLPNNFIVMNGDILCNLNYRQFFDDHVREGHQISVASCRREVNIDFGVLCHDKNGYLTEFQEKPTYHFDVSMGIYCINRAVIHPLPRGVKYGFDNLMMDWLRNKKRIHIKPFDGYWLDIGRPEDYQYADENFVEFSKKLGFECV